MHEELSGRSQKPLLLELKTIRVGQNRSRTRTLSGRNAMNIKEPADNTVNTNESPSLGITPAPRTRFRTVYPYFVPGAETAGLGTAAQKCV